MNITTAVVVFFAGVAVFFTVVGAVGVFRLPDVYTRAHAASKADTLGAGAGLVAVAVAFGTGSEALKAALLLVFIYITNPTAAHAISRAAYEEGIEPWKADADAGGDDE